MEARAEHSAEGGASRVARWLVPLVYAVSGLAFVMDLRGVNTLPYGIVYTPLVATSVFHRRRSSVWVLTGLTCLMVTVGAVFPRVGPRLTVIIDNRVLSVVAILITAAFVWHGRTVQEQLRTAQEKSEAAERIQAALVADLSEQIRTPLHTLLGIVTLAMAGSSPGQREALGQVRAGTRELLATVDNLIDLSAIEERSLHSQPVDMGALARDAVATADAVARERRVAVEMAPASGVAAVGDRWAIRRILDNLLANAVKLTPPGGTVAVSVERGEAGVTVSVSDRGVGLPPQLIGDLHANADTMDGATLAETGAAGLTLCGRLALAMGGRLNASNRPDGGATLGLTLPFVDGLSG